MREGFGDLPEGVGFFSPSSLIATWFGVGLLPGIPGTWGSAAALPFAWLIQGNWGSGALLIAAAVLLLAGIWASNVMVRAGGQDDPGLVVVDEVVGQWITVSVVSPSLVTYFAGFVLIRIFDVLKPWPANSLDRNVHGGLGIMADDLAAAIYAAPSLFILQKLGVLAWNPLNN